MSEGMKGEKENIALKSKTLMQILLTTNQTTKRIFLNPFTKSP